jgi:hypothetical protein
MFLLSQTVEVRNVHRAFSLLGQRVFTSNQPSISNGLEFLIRSNHPTLAIIRVDQPN